MLATRMDISEAAAASLVAVAAFGLSSASCYAWSGLVDWKVAALLLAGGVLGSLAGTRLLALLASRKALLTTVFAGVVIAAGLYVSIRGLLTLSA